MGDYNKGVITWLWRPLSLSPPFDGHAIVRAKPRRQPVTEWNESEKLFHLPHLTRVREMKGRRPPSPLHPPTPPTPARREEGAKGPPNVSNTCCRPPLIFIKLHHLKVKWLFPHSYIHHTTRLEPNPRDPFAGWNLQKCHSHWPTSFWNQLWSRSPLEILLPFSSSCLCSTSGIH